MRLILVRHGKTVENIQNILMGRTNGTLSEDGLRQAERAAQYLKAERIEVAYASDLGRAKQTMEAIIKFHPGLKVQYDPTLLERDFGIFTRKTHSDFYAAESAHGAAFDTFVPPGGESFAAVQKRVVKWFDSIRGRHANHTVLVVSHAIVIAALLLYLFKLPSSQWKNYVLANGGCRIVEIEEFGPPVRVSKSNV